MKIKCTRYSCTKIPLEDFSYPSLATIFFDKPYTGQVEFKLKKDKDHFILEIGINGEEIE